MEVLAGMVMSLIRDHSRARATLMNANPSVRNDRIAAGLSEVLAPLPLLIEDITVTSTGKRRLLRVLVDQVIADDVDPVKLVPPLDLEQVANVTRTVSDRLDEIDTDEIDTIEEQLYVLEVSSFGTNRPLVAPRNFRRNVGRRVAVHVSDGESLTGRITRAHVRGFEFEVADVKDTITTQYHCACRIRAWTRAT